MFNDIHAASSSLPNDFVRVEERFLIHRSKEITAAIGLKICIIPRIYYISLVRSGIQAYSKSEGRSVIT
jgi:hypothetical protein